MGDTSNPAWITDHPFKPDDRGWWSLCSHRMNRQSSDGFKVVKCGLAEAAHSASDRIVHKEG